MMEIKFNKYWWKYASICPIRVALDDHSLTVTTEFCPIFSADIEWYFAKNYWVKRGLFVDIEIGPINICSNPGKGEKEYTDE